MSSEFVRYAPEIESIDPHFDETLAQIIDFVEKKARSTGRYVTLPDIGGGVPQLGLPVRVPIQKRR